MIGLYELELVEQNENVFAGKQVKEELKIKTHYESLDIAGSRKIHYLVFRLPEAPIKNIDEELQQIIRHEEQLH